MNIFKNEIYCVVFPEEFRFKSYGKEKNLKTFIDVSEGKNPKVIAVGEDVSHQEPFNRVYLFKTTENNLKLKKSEYLTAYFKYAFKSVFNKFVVVRPTIIFENTSSLSSILGGYEKDILEHASLSASALKCIFK